MKKLFATDRPGFLFQFTLTFVMVLGLSAPLFAQEAQADPGNLTSYRGRNGQSFLFTVTGRTTGSVWGTDIYTDDSALAAAAVHAGVLQNGQTGLVRVTILPGQVVYSGSSRNGVTTMNYPAWTGSYRVDDPNGPLPDPGNLTSYRSQTGQSFLFTVTGRITGSVWGTDIYTDDSTLAAAAVHAGVLQNGQTGVVRVTILPGQNSYSGSTRNGVSTSNYPAWSGSYRVERP